MVLALLVTLATRQRSSAVIHSAERIDVADAMAA
jgi:hypothetical protein